MGASQTFKVTATPRERFALARLLLNRNLKFKDRGKERSLYRARKALGLMTVSEYLLLGNGVGDIWRDKTTRNVFTVTEDNADFVIATMGEIDKEGGELFMIEELADRLEAKRDADDVETCVAVDPAVEDPQWKPTLSPVITDPGKFIPILVDTLQGDQSFGVWQKKLLKALEPVKEEADAEVTPIAAAS